jgi:hypothetical protein
VEDSLVHVSRFPYEGWYILARQETQTETTLEPQVGYPLFHPHVTVELREVITSVFVIGIVVDNSYTLVGRITDMHLRGRPYARRRPSVSNCYYCGNTKNYFI